MLSTFRAALRYAFRRPTTPQPPTLPQQQFDAILDIASTIEQRSSPGLVALMRLLGRRLQAQCMSDAALTFDTEHVPTIDPGTVLFDGWTVITPPSLRIAHLLQRRDTQRMVALTHDIVLPWPWHRDRLAAALANIGPGRPWGPWHYDPHNHYVQVWEPLGICWVTGGNHSIAAGIVQGVGSLPAEEVYDIGALYDHVVCDGVHFLHRNDGYTIAPVKNIECAAIFEIGRLLLRHGLSA